MIKQKSGQRAKRFLDNIRQLREEIDSNKESIEQIKAEAERTTADTERLVTGNVEIIRAAENYIWRLEELESKLKKDLAKAYTAKSIFAEILAKMPEGKMRMVMQDHYLLFKDVKTIAEVRGMGVRTVEEHIHNGKIYVEAHLPKDYEL